MIAQENQSYPKPLKKSGALDHVSYEDLTPTIGREYINVNIVDDLLSAHNADELLRDLAITISERGVVFFRAQQNLTNDIQKQVVHRLGQLTGKPSTSSLHIHPMLNDVSEFGNGDPEISHISHVNSIGYKKSQRTAKVINRGRYDAGVWHSDVQFEPVTPDYTSLRLTKIPQTGGDTLWASGYEVYERFSPAYQKFFEGLTATFAGDTFTNAKKANPDRVRLYEKERGSPLNVGTELTAVHPVVRTNPVTGWKSIFPIGPFPKYINELTAHESEELLKKFLSVVTENHDLQVRFKWRNENDFAIWDNRSVFHSATLDYDGLGDRFGHRAVGIGEAPFLDPNSKCRSDALAEEGRLL